MIPRSFRRIALLLAGCTIQSWLLVSAQTLSSFSVERSPDEESLLLKWPDGIKQWILKSNATLDPTGWTALSQTPTLGGGIFSLEVPIAGGAGRARFFRLESENLIFVDAANPSPGNGSRLNPFQTIPAAVALATSRFEALGIPQTIYVFEGDYTAGFLLNGAGIPGLAVSLMDSSVAIALDGKLVGGGARARITPATAQPGIEVSSVHSFSLTGFEIACSNAPGVSLSDLSSFGADGTSVTVNGGLHGIRLQNVAGGSARFSTVAISNTSSSGIEMMNVGGRFEIDDQDPETFASASTISNSGAGGAALRIAQSTGWFRFSELGIANAQAGGILLDHAGAVELSFCGIDGGTGSAVDSLNTVLKTEFIFVGLLSPINGDGFSIRNTDGVNRTYESITDTVFGGSGKGWMIESTGTGTLRAEVTASFDIRGSDTCILARGGNAPDSLHLHVWGFSCQAAPGLSAIDVAGAVPGSVVMTRFDQGQITSNLGTAGGAIFDRVTFDADPKTPGIQPVIGTGNVHLGSTVSPNVPHDIQRLTGVVLKFLNPGGDLRFAELNLEGKDTTAIAVDTTGDQTTFALHVASGTIDVNNGAALDLRSMTAQLHFSHFRSRFAPLSGVLVNDVEGVLGVTEEFIVIGQPGPQSSLVNSPNFTITRQ